VTEFDHEEHVQHGQPDGFDGQKITRQHPGGLGAQELGPTRPAAARCRPEAVAAQDGAHRGRRNSYAEFAALADDA
jgi:hypothetical protein